MRSLPAPPIHFSASLSSGRHLRDSTKRKYIQIIKLQGSSKRHFCNMELQDATKRLQDRETTSWYQKTYYCKMIPNYETEKLVRCEGYFLSKWNTLKELTMWQNYDVINGMPYDVTWWSIPSFLRCEREYHWRGGWSAWNRQDLPNSGYWPALKLHFLFQCSNWSEIT